MIVSAKDMLWKERIAQWYESGLTQSDYARKIGVAQRSISYWAYKLRALHLLPEEACQAVEISQPAAARLSAEQALPALLPVRIGAELAAPPAETTSTIVLSNAHGWTLSLPSGVPASWLAELMRGL